MDFVLFNICMFCWSIMIYSAPNCKKSPKSRGYQTIRHTICGYRYPTYSISICWTIIIEVQCHVHLSYSYLGTVWWNVCIPWIPVARVCWLIIEMIFRDWDQFRTNLERIWNKILDNSHKQKYVSRWLTAKATANLRSYLWLLG